MEATPTLLMLLTEVGSHKEQWVGTIFVGSSVNELKENMLTNSDAGFWSVCLSALCLGGALL